MAYIGDEINGFNAGWNACKRSKDAEIAVLKKGFHGLELEIAEWKKRANDLECEISTLDLIISRKDAEIAELLDWSHKALKHLPQAYWDSLKEITEKHKVK